METAGAASAHMAPRILPAPFRWKQRLRTSRLLGEAGAAGGEEDAGMVGLGLPAERRGDGRGTGGSLKMTSVFLMRCLGVDRPPGFYHAAPDYEKCSSSRPVHCSADTGYKNAPGARIAFNRHCPPLFPLAS